MERGHAELVERVRARARTLYEGREVPHHSCGIAIATTFALPSRPYQSLRKGASPARGRAAR